MALSGSPATAWRSRRRSSVPRATSRSRDLSFSIHWSKGASSTTNASRRCPAYSDATPSSASRVSAPTWRSRMATSTLRCEASSATVVAVVSKAGRSLPGSVLRSVNSAWRRLARAWRDGASGQRSPWIFSRSCGCPGMEREICQQCLRLPGGQANRRRADPRLEPAEERGIARASVGGTGTRSRCALSTGGGQVSSRCPGVYRHRATRAGLHDTRAFDAAGL